MPVWVTGGLLGGWGVARITIVSRSTVPQQHGCAPAHTDERPARCDERRLVTVSPVKRVSCHFAWVAILVK